RSMAQGVKEERARPCRRASRRRLPLKTRPRKRLRCAPMTTSLAGRVAVVTGGGRGIGVEICRQLAALGAHVVVSGRDHARIEKVAAELPAPGKGTAVVCDVTRADDIARLVGATHDTHVGPASIVINNAGVA